SATDRRWSSTARTHSLSSSPPKSIRTRDSHRSGRAFHRRSFCDGRRARVSPGQQRFRPDLTSRRGDVGMRTAGEPDVATVIAAREGRPDAVDRLVGAYLPLVYNIVGRAIGGRPDVDDVVQDTLVRAPHGVGNPPAAGG